MTTRTQAHRMRALEIRPQVLALRCSGLSMRTIGKRLGVSRTSVLRHLDAALGELASETRERANELRAIELARLDEMLVGLWSGATSGDVPSVNAALRVAERRAKLCGLDAPARSEVAGPNGGPVQTRLEGFSPDYSRLSDDELLQLEVLATKLAPPGEAAS